MLKKILLYFLIFAFCLAYTCCTHFNDNADEFTTFNLGGDDWKFKNFKGRIKGQATVPGNIYQDLVNNGIIDETSEFADVNNTWVAHESWVYTKLFNISRPYDKLVMKSLDTYGFIEINNNRKFIFFENMFVKKEVDIKDQLSVGNENLIKIFFHSPIILVNEKAKKFKEENGFDLQPAKLPQQYHGVDHANFIRKMQAAFSWDWGRQKVTSGIVDEIYLSSTQLDVDSAIIETVRVNTTRNDGSKDWLIKSKIYLRLNRNLNFASKFRFYLNDEEIQIDLDKATRRITGQSGDIVLNKFELGPFSSDKIFAWYPNKFDYLQENDKKFKPNLYNFRVEVENRNGSVLMNKRSFRIGFKEIELKEDTLSDGKAFYFKINGLPFFAKGINYIPTTLNVGNLTEQKTKFTYLLHQVKEANMNMIRIWGGGIYELDEFYDLADELGILIWQDFMYACALYEADPQSLESAKEEVTYQVRRLQHHPSIAIFAGNNEIEGAISNKWWTSLNNPNSSDKVKKDYIELFEKTIRYTVTNLTTAIPFVGSSPTNDDDEPFDQPSNPKKGDIHFYSYGKDPLNEKKYLRARFASEFGFQSYPSISTLAKSLKREHLVWPITSALEHRQHCQGQNDRLIDQINENFDFKNQNSISQEALEEFIYLTQVIQALGVKVEAEGYLHDRDENLWQPNDYSLRPNVHNINMGSLIWQLNDIWEAPTWSTIDYYNNYKILQYYIKKFYNPIHVVANRENDILVISLINDSLIKVKLRYRVTIYKSENGYLEPSSNATVRDEIELDRLSVMKRKINLTEQLEKANCNRPESCFVRIDYNYVNKILSNFYLLGRPKDLNLKPVQINSKITRTSDQKNKYIIIVNSVQSALFVELSWKLGSNIEGHLSDNGFNLLNEERHILFESKHEYDIDYLEDNLQIRSLSGKFK